MPFRANFVAIRRGTSKLRIEGETNEELLAAAERMYIGVAPLKRGPQEMTVYDVPLLSDWSVDYKPGRSSKRLTCVGVVILRSGAPFMWTQVLELVSDVIADERPRPDAGS
jgi:hypothetical protein